MPKPMQPPAPVTYRFADDGYIPNNPVLPLVLYRGVIDLAGWASPEEAIEKAFGDNGWGSMWRNGIYPYAHYHSMIHEAMGVARGRATVRFGGETGQEIEIEPGDVVILPAGTGHQCLKKTPNLIVVGAYPPTGQYNLCRGSMADHQRALVTIPKVPPPDADPVFGAEGPLMTLWGVTGAKT